MDSIMNYPTNWKRMQIFDYKCHSNLPLDIQKVIILYSENFWYNEIVDIIIKHWYAYIGKKIVAQYIYSKMEIIPMEIYPYMHHNLYVEPIIVYLIDPLKYINQIIYVCKILKGTEDVDFWRSFLEKIACGLKFIYEEDNDKINTGEYSLYNDDIMKLNQLITINNYIVKVRDKFSFPIFIGSFILQSLMTLREQSHIPIYS
jgi:hypothetical protein